MRKALVHITLAIAMLAVGGAVYLLWRPQRLVMSHVADWLGFSDAIGRWRAAVEGVVLPEWSVFCLPNALWSAAYILTADAVTSGGPLSQRLTVASLIPAVGLVSEAMQALGLLPGTADWLDALAYALPYLVYLTCIQTYKTQMI